MLFRSAVNLALHYILQHLDSTRTYARILFQALLQEKPSQLSVPDSSCRWITDFLSDRKQHVKLVKNVSDSQTISTGSPQGSFFLLCSITCTHTTVMSDGDESAYRWEIDNLVTWSRQNNLDLNGLKTVEMVVDFRKN